MIIQNPSYQTLYKHCLEQGCKLSSTGAIIAYSGEKTGRSPKDKRIVYSEKTKNIWWGKVNIPLDKELHTRYLFHAIDHMASLDKIYQMDGYAGWDSNYCIKVRINCCNPYHALFMKNMIRPSEKPFDKPDFTIYNVGHLKISDVNQEKNIKGDDSISDTLVSLNLDDNNMIIYGTKYAGEMKKGILTLMMYLMPHKHNFLTLHSSANVDNKGNCSFFFGLSGTGKTTLSADPKRKLIGDDEHVWTDEGIFNIEGGCYAKCIDLSLEKEPDIFKAIRYKAVLENVVCHGEDNVVDYHDISLTVNTRSAYPLQNINKIAMPSIGPHPSNIVLLTCDAFGVLPPVSLLNKEQAIYFFLSGYTTKIPGTEQGIVEPIATFSTCFGEPFIVHRPELYGGLLGEMIEKHNTKVWMVNTGWTGGQYGTGERFKLKYTRAIIDAIHDGSLIQQNYQTFSYFNVKIPTACNNVPDEILNPINTWNEKNKYQKTIKKLLSKFKDNFKEKHEIYFDIFD